MPVIAVENLKYRYPNTESLALDGLSFTVEKGEFIGIVGENGAGKSTLSQALIGLVPQFYKGAYGGRVLIEDLPAETTPISELCCKVGLVFQNPFNQLSGAKDNVYEEVAFGMQNLGVPGRRCTAAPRKPSNCWTSGSTATATPLTFRAARCSAWPSPACWS